MLRDEDKKLIKPGTHPSTQKVVKPQARPGLAKAKAAESRFRNAVKGPAATSGKRMFPTPVFGRRAAPTVTKSVDDPSFLTKENSSMGWQSRLAMNKQIAATHRERLGNQNNLQVSSIRANAMLGAEGMRQEGAGARQGARQAFLGDQQQKRIDANKDSAAIATQDKKDLAGIKNTFQIGRDERIDKYNQESDKRSLGATSLSEGRFKDQYEAENFFNSEGSLDFGAGFNYGPMAKSKGYSRRSGKSTTVKGKGVEGESIVQTEYPTILNEDTGQVTIDFNSMTTAQRKKYLEEEFGSENK